MKRFFGMMPSSEIEMSKSYKDKMDWTVSIQAGPNGWTVMYADNSSEYKDVVDTTENNFAAALKVAEQAVGKLTESDEVGVSEG